MHPGKDEAYGGGLNRDLVRQYTGVPEQPLDLSLTPVNRWRYGVFRDAGFDEIQAHALAISNSDVHKVIEALESGCSLELALEIFF